MCSPIVPLQADEIQATELYSTDPEIITLGLRVLRNDRRYFPRYECVWLYRLAIAPLALTALGRLEGVIDEATMSRMNAEVTRDRRPDAEVAARFCVSGWASHQRRLPMECRHDFSPVR